MKKQAKKAAKGAKGAKPKAQKPKSVKEAAPRKVRGPKPAPTTVAGSNSVDPDKRALFLKNKDDYEKAIDRLSKAQSAVRLIGKTIKSDGFTLRQIKLAIQLETPEGEQDFKMLIANDLIAAQYAGAEVGAQLSLFLEPTRVPAADMAFDEGVKDSMEGKSAKPGYDPSTEQHRRYMEGFHSDTARRVKAKGGIGKLEPKDDDKPRADVLAEARSDNEASATLN